MNVIPFAKFHGAENDFIISLGTEAGGVELPTAASRICARNTGIGADGWMLIWPESGGIRTRLFNSDGSEAEISGNGTRCAAAFALLKGLAYPPFISVTTAAGVKKLRLVSQERNRFVFEMDMGAPRVEELRSAMELAGARFDATILNVGNPQCAIFVDDVPQNWRDAAAEAERHSRFPNRSNVSFVRILDRHTIDVLFYERGAGETRSSGTGSTGAAVSAIERGLAESPVKVLTPAGPLTIRWDSSVYLTGPAELIAEGKYYLDSANTGAAAGDV
ncbi:MAG TPA: diaminopimelate epimerase [Bryobacteraceae bacterium]|jgi:diaminopimelate epimerase|nr:diaminopimelate epimerase [Bryobacteraceae bacterium]